MSRERLLDIGLQHRGGLGEILVGLHQHRQARDAGDRDVAGVEQVVADLHDVLADRLVMLFGADLQRAREMQLHLQLAVGRLLDLLGQHLGAARGGEIRRRLVHVEIPVLRSRRLPLGKDHGDLATDKVSRPKPLSSDFARA